MLFFSDAFDFGEFYNTDNKDKIMMVDIDTDFCSCLV